MKTSLNRSFALATAGVLAASTASAQNLIADGFETDSSANYTVVDDSTPNGTSDFQFDYIAAGIPLAPRSAPGDTKGLRFTANDSNGSADGLTAYHNTSVGASRYILTVDVYVAFDSSTSGTTEHAHVGVGGNTSTWNQLFSPISGSGAFIAFDGDGGSISDYRWFRDPNNTPTNETANTTLPNDHPSYLGHGSNNTGSFFQSLFPNTNGSPGNIWTTLTIDVDNTTGVIAFYFDGVLTFQGDFDNAFDGLVSLGYCDVFSSVDPGTQFVVYDNLDVSIPTTSIGSNYCTAAANQSGQIGVMSATGSDVATANDVTLMAGQLPLNQFGIFIVSRTQGFIPGVNGTSNGNLCLSGSIGRYTQPSQIQSSGSTGTFSMMIDTSAVPQGGGTVGIAAGETWNFQAWFREGVGQGSNFTDGLEITFQ